MTSSFDGNEIWNARMQTMAFVHAQRDADEAEMKVILTLTNHNFNINFDFNATEMKVTEERAKKQRKRAEMMSQMYARLGSAVPK